MEAARPAEAAELSRLVELAAAAAAEAASFRGGALLTRHLHGEDPVALAAWLDQYRRDDTRALLAGTLDDSVVGLAAVRADTDPPLGTYDLLYVEPEARGVGVGAALVETGIEWLRRAGCTAVDVAALPGARGTKQFLEGAGLAARLIVMHRAI